MKRIKALMIYGVTSILLAGAVSAQNLWTTKTSFPGSIRTNGSPFTLDLDSDGIADKAFIFGGSDNNGTDYNDLWQYDPVTDVWTQKANLPSFGRRGVVTFALNNCGFIATGAHHLGVAGDFLDEVWMYNPITNSWTQKSTFPGRPRWGSITFTLKGYGYLAMGDSGSVTNPQMINDVWKYDPNNDSWTRMNSFPGERRRLCGQFNLDIDDDGIADLGFMSGGITPTRAAIAEFWAYDPHTDTWTQKVDLPGGAGRYDPLGFSIRSKGYMGFGSDSTLTYSYKDLYEYDYGSNTWLRMTDLPAAGRRDAFCFTIKDSAYIGNGSNGQIITDFHKFVPFLYVYNVIRGKIYVDANHNCIADNGEERLRDWIVKATPGPYYANTDSNGNYAILVDSGTYTVSQLTTTQQSPLAAVNCPVAGSYQVAFHRYYVDTSGFDFSDSARNCPFLTVDINTGSKHRCQDNLDIVHYCNTGFATAQNIDIYVQLPGYVSLVSADHAYTYNVDSNLVFHIDSLLPGECRDIHIVDHIDCAHSDYIGLTACVSAWITPANNCPAPDSGWCQANLDPSIQCAGGDSSVITITNNGTGSMTDSTEYRVYMDNNLVFVGKVKLATGASWSINLITGGQTIRVEVDQPAHHPYNTTSYAWLEGCGSDTPTPFSRGFVLLYATDPVEPERSTDCLVIDGAWDPNDKTVSPEGLTSNHYVLPGTSLDYNIRFQNTGNAIARKVVVVDTLSPFLDLATLRVTGCSHPYVLHISGVGRPVLTFTFNNINLPDSGTSQLLSQGFASFSIKPLANSALGTVINNNANIYFDLNRPVVTNATLTTISDYKNEHLTKHLEGNTLVEGLNEIDIAGPGISLFPNPNNGRFVIGFTQAITGRVDMNITDLSGRVLWFKNIYDIVPTIMPIDAGKLSKGMYLFNIRTNDVSVTKKIAVD